MYNKIIKILSVLIIIFQFSFLPGLSLEAGMDSRFKLFAFLFLLLLLFSFYFLRVFHKEELVVNKSAISISLFIFLLVVFVSSLFSLDKSMSFLGAEIDIGYAFSYLSGLFLFFYFLINYYNNKESVSLLLRTFLYAYTTVLAFSYFVFIAYFFKFSFLTQIERALFLMTGSFRDLALYIAVVSVFIFAVSINKVGAKMLFPNHNAKKFLRFILFFSILQLIIMNFLPAWICLVTGMVFVLFAYYIINKVSGWEVVSGKQMFKKTFYLFLAVFFLILNLSFLSNRIFERQLDRDLKLGYARSLQITTASLREKPFLGNGGETFSYVFSKHRPQSMNDNEMWNLRYRRSASYFLEMAVSFGVFGIGTYLILIFFILKGVIGSLNFAVNKYRNGGNIEKLGIFLGILGTIFSLIVSNFVYSANMMLLFLLFLFLTFLFIYNKSFQIPSKTLNHFELIKKKEKPLYFNLFIASFLVAIISLLAFSVINFKIVLAGIYYNNFPATEDRLRQIVSLNDYDEKYLLDLLNFYRTRISANIDLAESENLQNEIIEDYRRLENITSLIISRKPHVSIIERVAKIYLDLEAYVPGSYRFAIEYFLLANELEPSNPVLMNSLARAYTAGEDSSAAKKYFKKAFELKSDYYEAKFNLAKLLLDENEREEAIVLFEELIKNQYNTQESFYALGKIYFNNGNYGKAIENFEQVILMSPNHSNALYSIALAYEEIEDKDIALHYLKRVQVLNPDNTEINEKIETLSGL